ncbi:MAG TPA: ABC transporter ATP-binding protein [Anaerolineae bacterium]|nr:ABC transporter ATP-binding protein [Anaerolineae bacterium]HQI84210.1 ABC transporter ATP-binding protein [Anaerolineae bacterium]
MKSIKALLKYLKPYWVWAVLAPLLMMLEVAMDLMQPRMIQRIVDVGLAQLDMQVVINTGLLMIGFALLGAVGGVGCTIFSILAAMGFGTDLRNVLFAKVQSLSFGNLDDLETGQLVTRLTNDVVQVQELVSMMLRIMVRAPLMLIGSLVMVVITSPRLAMLVVVLAPAVTVMLVWVIKKAYPMFGEVQRRLDNLNTVMQENLAGVRVVKAFVRAAHEIARFGRVNDALMDQTVRAARTVAVTWPFMMTAVNLGVVGALWFGGALVNNGAMQIGQLIAFVNYLMRTLMSLMFVSMLIMRMARAQASAGRIQEVMDAVPEVQTKPNALVDFAPQGRVAFEGVTFSYDSDGRDLVLGGGKSNNGGPPGISFVAEPGQTVAVLGATGSGKSSLIHLIPRFYDVNSGRVTIDGVDVRDLDEATLRRHIGIALQESVLFSGTIRDNIRYGRPEATDEEVIAAAKAAQAHDFIMEFPDGYDTVVGQRGVNLSGGQKQRIAIARALLVQPAVLILDDSTSSVDVETETKIQEALEGIMKNRTSFVIAQRISTVLNADKILVLDDGRVVAEGTHRELLATSPVYREIYDSQLGNGVVSHV